MKFTKDPDGHFHAIEEGELALFADFLQSDVQGDKKAGVELLDMLERKAGERIGNAYCCRFEEKHVILEGLYGDDIRLVLDRNVFFQGVEAWVMFISD